MPRAIETVKSFLNYGHVPGHAPPCFAAFFPTTQAADAAPSFHPSQRIQLRHIHVFLDT